MIKNVRFSEYRFYVNSKIQGDSQICISVPLSKSDPGTDPCGTPKIISVLLLKPVLTLVLCHL